MKTFRDVVQYDGVRQVPFLLRVGASSRDGGCTDDVSGRGGENQQLHGGVGRIEVLRAVNNSGFVQRTDVSDLYTDFVAHLIATLSSLSLKVGQVDNSVEDEDGLDRVVLRDNP